MYLINIRKLKKFFKKIIRNKILVTIIVALIGISSVFFFGKDNPVEEIAEEIIKEETGLDIDLTPNSHKK